MVAVAISSNLFLTIKFMVFGLGSINGVLTAAGILGLETSKFASDVNPKPQTLNPKPQTLNPTP